MALWHSGHMFDSFFLLIFLFVSYRLFYTAHSSKRAKRVRCRVASFLKLRELIQQSPIGSFFSKPQKRYDPGNITDNTLIGLIHRCSDKGHTHSNHFFQCFFFSGSLLFRKITHMSCRGVTEQRLTFVFTCSIFRVHDLYNEFYHHFRRVPLKSFNIVVAIRCPENDSSESDAEEPWRSPCSSPVEASGAGDIPAVFAMFENAGRMMSKLFLRGVC